ncbi:HamA C-terminal domain-containing protein [Azospirillum isscasi]|nr:DUF1837 domain-containing protein [Azospirillum isscasi]
MTDLSYVQTALAALEYDYTKLAPRIRTLDHSVTCNCEGVVLRLHYPAFRQGLATMQELVDTIFHFITPFCLPRSDVTSVKDLYGKVSVDEFTIKYEKLSEEARSLFKRANKTTNRNGEAGELLLYLLTEWVLEAPQIIAKMSLKTNRAMPVHGADGVHARYCSESSRLFLYWGESKIYSDVGDAISEAMKSIIESLDPEKMKHELDLMKRNIGFTGFSEVARKAFLDFLDPFCENYNERHDIITCLIGFDFDAYANINAAKGNDSEKEFVELAKLHIAKLSPRVARAMTTAGLVGRPIELFFFPVPSVKDFRDLFQAKIGWAE